MSNIGKGFEAELEQHANRILKAEEIVGEELDLLNNALGSWIE